MRRHGIRFRLFRFLGGLIISSILFSPVFTIPVKAQTNTIRFENISTEQGLSQSTVHAILQDRQGFLWFATEGGLDKYDGYQFTVYQHDPGNSQTLSDNLISSLYQDAQGNLWVGTSTGLDRFDPQNGTAVNTFRYPDMPPALVRQSATAIFQDHTGELWVGTGSGGLAAINPTTNKVQLYMHSTDDPHSLASNSVDVIFEDSAGELWIGTDEGLDHFLRSSGTFELAFGESRPNTPSIGKIPVYALAETTGGNLWIGTNQGLFRWERGTNQLAQYQHDPNGANGISDNTVTCFLKDAGGQLWIGTRAGLSLFEAQQNTFISFRHDPNDPSSLASDSVRSISEDRSGVLWIGTSAGLSKYSPASHKFSVLAHVPGSANSLSDNNVWAVLKDRSGGLWVGTFSAGLNHVDPQSGRVTVYQHDPLDPGSLSSNEIRVILEDHTGTLWVGTERGGLDRFDPATNTFTHYLHDPGNPVSLSGNNVFALYEDQLDRLWIGTSDGGLNRMDQSTGTFMPFQHNDGNPNSLSDDNVRAIQIVNSSMMWVGTLGGLNLFYDEGNIFLKYVHNPAQPASLSSDLVDSLYSDKDGALWIGTMGGGLERLDKVARTFSLFTVKDGLPDNSVYCILGDGNGNLWLSTNKGLSRFNPATQTFRNYDTSDGLQGNQFNPGACTQGPDGEMYFGGTNGLNVFQPAQVEDNPLPPPVVITSFQEFNKTVQTDLPSNTTVKLSYLDNFISFNFSALDYNAPEKNQYAYMMEGVDKDWVFAGTRRYASYTNLGGGNYTFRVKASNNDGVWNSAGTIIHIHITPPFWQTWWFIGLVCLVAGAGAFGGYRMRVRDIEARNRELAQRVEQRTHELATLNTISTVVNRSLDLTEILNAALDETMAVMGMDIGLAFRSHQMANDASDEPSSSLLAYRGVSEEYANAIAKSLPLQDTMHEKAFLAGLPIVNLTNTHPIPIRQVQEANEREGIQMGINVPLFVKGKLVGGLSLAARKTRQIAPEELSLLAAIGQQVGMAVVNAQLFEQAEQTAIATERSRLARELHDSVTQLLYSVTLYAEAAAELLDSGESETAAGHLRDLRDTAQEALREMRLLIFELHRPELEKGGLAAALQARLDAVERRGGMHAELSVDGIEQISRSIQAELYNIAQEALNNALKHAHAKSIRIQLRFEPAETVMEISDDGVGFEPPIDGKGGGFGIPGMQERSQKIGGKLQIKSEVGKGTSVIVKVPVNPTDRGDPSASGSPEKRVE